MKLFHAVFRSIGGLVFRLLLVSFLLFWLADLLPGDAALRELGLHASEQSLQNFRREFGLDDPWYQRYVLWLGGLVQGEMGMARSWQVPVADLLKERLRLSLPLVGMAVVWILGLGLATGVLSAWSWGQNRARHRPIRPLDLFLSIFNWTLLSVPNFWLGLLFLTLFVHGLGWQRALFTDWSAPWEALLGLILPSLALGLPQAALLSRIVRSGLIGFQGRDVFLYARSLGLSRLRILFTLGLRHAALPSSALVGLQISFLLSASALVETVFNLPGLGTLAIRATLARDLILLKTLLLFFVLVVMVVNWVVDQVWHLTDPRLRNAGWRF